MVGIDEESLKSWGPAVWEVVFDRLQSGNVKGGVIAWPSNLDKKTPTQQIQWATKLPLVQLPQKTLETIYDRFVGFSVGVRYMDERKIHALHTLLIPHAILKSSVEKWLKNPETINSMRALIRSYKDHDETMRHIIECKTFPRETDNHPCKTNPTYDAAVLCSDCLKFLVDWKIVTLIGYDSSGRNWIEAGLNGPNIDLLTYMVSNVDPRHLIQPRDVRELDENHILTSLVGVGAFSQFVIALKRLKEAGLASIEELRTIFHDAVMHEFCAVAPVQVAEALYQHGINIGNVEHQYHELGGQLESSWHIAAAFNPAGAEFMTFLEKFSMLGPENRNSENMNPLMYAACFDEPGAIEWLCKKSDPTLPRLADGPEGYALICAARSSYMRSGEIFAIILSNLPRRLFTPEYGKIFGTEIAEGLASHKRKLADGRIDEPTQGTMELLAVRKMQALVRRLPPSWTGSSWHLALDAFVRDNNVQLLRHSIGTVTRELRRRSGNANRVLNPPSPTLAQRLREENENGDPINMTDFDALLGVGPSQTLSRSARADQTRRNRPAQLTARSGGGQTALGPTRDPNNMITKTVRKRQPGRWS
ncbi:hypothetical protein N7475_001520 [Penicillium sp. IBT 31633x]|nr:hypothetical protein N7475_001520 [Penicillium sp. IBT 31633x]